MVSDQNICTRHRHLRQFSSERVQCVRVLDCDFAHNNAIYQHFIILSLKKIRNRWYCHNCLSEMSALRPDDWFWTWGFGAAAQSLCSAYAHAEPLRCGKTAAPSWAPVASSQSLSGGTFWCETGGSSYLTVGECPQTQGHTLVHPQQRSASGTCASHAFSGGARTFSQGWPEWDHCSHRGGPQTDL